MKEFRMFFIFCLMLVFTAIASGVSAQEKAGPPTGSWGPGLSVGHTGGYTPSIQFNALEKVALEGSIDIYSGVTALGAEMYYHFVRYPANSPSTLLFEPVVGVGIHKVSVDLGLGDDESFTGFSVSGGVFAHLRENPHWRFKGVLTFMKFNYEGVDLRGLNGVLGAYYFF